MNKGKTPRVLLGFLVLVLVAIPLLVTACDNGDDDDVTPTPTVALTPTPTSTLTPTVTEEPRISFDEDSVYLGEATPEQLMHYEFRFQNTGNAPLVVDSARAKALEGC